MATNHDGGHTSESGDRRLREHLARDLHMSVGIEIRAENQADHDEDEHRVDCAGVAEQVADAFHRSNPRSAANDTVPDESLTCGLRPE